MPRIIVVDDHGLYRKGLRFTLEQALLNLEIFEADTLQAVITELQADGNWDLVLIDLNVSGHASIGGLREVRELYPRPRILVISASNAKADVLSCLAVGLHGFVCKLQPDDEIVAAVKIVLDGGIYVPKWLAQIEVFELEQHLGPGLAALQDQNVRLTPRQRDVLSLLVRGMSNKEIARALKIAEATTKIHAAALCRILGARNRTEAALAGRALIEKSG